MPKPSIEEAEDLWDRCTRCGEDFGGAELPQDLCEHCKIEDLNTLVQKLTQQRDDARAMAQGYAEQLNGSANLKWEELPHA